MSLQQYLFELTQLGLNLEEEIRKIVKANEGKIVGLVKNRLFQTGKSGSGSLITPPYTEYTISVKKQKRQRSSFVTLRDEGLFYKGFYLELKGYTILLDSTDSKTDELVDKYGEDILFFTEQEKLLIIDTMIEPALLKIVNNLGTSSAGTIDLDTF